MKRKSTPSSRSSSTKGRRRPKLSFYDLLPVRTARPGEKWWPWRQLMSVGERRREYDLIGPEDRWPQR